MELVILFAIVLGIIITTLKFKIHPVFSLTGAAIVAGLAFGLSADQVMVTIGEGFGKTLSGIGLVIAFGTVIGTFLEKTGGTQVLSKALLRLTGLRRSPLAVNLAGFVISIPVYCDSGFVILSSLNEALSRRSGVSRLTFTVALATGLYAAHVFVPPTPGPLAAAALVEADLGLVMLYGLPVALGVALSGYLWALIVGKNAKSSAEDTPLPEVLKDANNSLATPSGLLVMLLPIAVPLGLIALKSVATYPTNPLGEGWIIALLDFLGNPIIALAIGLLLSLSWIRKKATAVVSGWVGEAMKQAGAIVLITGAGGAFGAVLRTLDFAAMLSLSAGSGGLGLLLAFAIAAVIKTAQGSSTVALITTAAIITPLLASFHLEGALERALAVLAIGAGALTVSHINDSYFWVVTEFSEMDLKTALRGHTLATLLQGLVGITLILMLYWLS
ncbi:MAG: GntP family permease [Bacteroidota bacterium]